MAPPVLVNTYVALDNNPHIDLVSKIFILIELPLGIVRVPLLGNISLIIKILSVLYAVGAAGYGIKLIYNVFDVNLVNIVITISYLQCCFYMIFNLVSIKRMRRFYNELKAFDKETGCRPKIAKGTIRNIIQALAMLLYIAMIFALPHIFEELENLYFGSVPFVLCHILEVHYTGHLLSLLIPRLRLINYYMELSLNNSKPIKAPKVEDFGGTKSSSNKSLCKMEKLMNLYHNMIKSYNYLIEAIKWQLLVTIVASFINVLFCCYKISLTIIKQQAPLTFMITYLGLSLGLMLPLFAPCILGDQVHNEVRRLRELLASRLYENQLDKSSRGMARALLAWTETRDLSFSLLRMLDIDISLPFKFVGLLITYLIILLQFQKVINP